MIKESKQNYTIHFFSISSLCSYYIADLIKKLEICLTVLSVLLKIGLGHTQISVPKIGMPMLKTACINPCQQINKTNWCISLQKRKFQKTACMKLKLLIQTFCISKNIWVFIKRKHEIDLDATYFKVHSTKINFPTLEISNEYGGGFAHVPYNNFRFSIKKLSTLALPQWKFPPLIEKFKVACRVQKWKKHFCQNSDKFGCSFIETEILTILACPLKTYFIRLYI